MPEWYDAEPPDPPDMRGTAPGAPAPSYNIAHATVLPATTKVDETEPWLSLILYSNAPDSSPTAMYHNEGEVLALRGHGEETP